MGAQDPGFFALHVIAGWPLFVAWEHIFFAVIVTISLINPKIQTKRIALLKKQEK